MASHNMGYVCFFLICPGKNRRYRPATFARSYYISTAYAGGGIGSPTQAEVYATGLLRLS